MNDLPLQRFARLMRGFTHIRVKVVISREDAQKIGY
ncbi:hypothetical protein CFSAN001081_09835 [Salmonella enterica subsp. enterica serovar London str. CFSAN001081]|nr:hypothetical protein CFSAN001081_09835 [Salmonella enterica subsp. enterica serovar London str. CFSAN001081]